MESNAVTYENLRLSTYEVEHITYLSLSKSANDHASLDVVAILGEQVADRYIYTTNELTPIMLSYKSETDEDIVLFKGMVTSLQISKQGGVFYMNLSAKGATCIMAIQQKRRSFQNTSMTTHQVIAEVLSQYENANFIAQIPDLPIGGLLLQYQETDWAFLKRLVSWYGATIIPEVRADGIACFVGVPENNECQHIDAFRYRVSKSIESYEIMKNNGWPEVQEIEYVIFTVENEQIFQIGDNVELDGKSLYVESAVHVLEDGILKNTYALKLKEGFKSLKVYNTTIVGCSLNGTVIGVARDKLMIDLEIDGAGRAAYWFPYSTMSASPDGSGWYCMPEKGDQVRVYFPTKEEKDAYAISAISGHEPKAGDSQDPMGDPNIKRLSTIYDKVILFAEEGILINSDSGQASVFLGKNGQITLYGAESVNVTAEKEVAIIAQESVLIGATQSVTLKNSGASIEIKEDGNITLQGKKVYSN